VRPLDELLLVERAYVFKAGVEAALLERLDHAVRFSYLPSYLASNGRAVATTLPVSDAPVTTHAPGALPPFFSGLLPEGRRLSALQRAAKTSADDEFTLLLAVGGDVIGDVQIVPEGEAPPVEVDPRLSVDDWGSVDFGKLFAASVARAADIDRVGLAGVQDKISARMMTVPVAMRGHRFFLKLNPPEFPHLVENEAFFLAAARKSGLDTADAWIVEDATGATGLCVRRFDRTVDSAGVSIPMAQEDACQVLGRYPADKYRLTTEDVIRALSALCRAQPVAALNLLTQFAFAYLTLNGDAHGKNFSIQFLPTGEWRVTPAYDLPSTYPYGDTTMALTVNGSRKEDIGRKDFLELAASVGLRPRSVERRLDQLLDAVPLWVDDLDGLPFDGRTLHTLKRAVRYRKDRLA